MNSVPGHDPWAEANTMLAQPHVGVPRSVVRHRRRRMGIALTAVLVAGAMGAVLMIAFGGGSAQPDDVPVGQQVVGYVLVLAGLGLQFRAIRRQWRGSRGPGHWSGPLVALSGGQRGQLRQQVLGRRPVQVGTEQLSVLRAQLMVQQRLAVEANAGLLVWWTGLWVAGPAVWRGLLVVVLGVLLLAGTPFIERDARVGERFLLDGSDS